MCIEILLPTMHRTDQSRRPSSPSVLAGPFGRAPAGGQPVLRSRQIVGQLLAFGDLSAVLVLPPITLSRPPILVPAVPTAVRPRQVVAGRIQIKNRRGDIREQRPVVADQNHAAGMHLQLSGQIRETARIQVIGGLVEQQQFVPRTQQTRQPDPIPLPDRQRRQHPAPIVDRTQRRKRDIDPPIGVPCVQRLSDRESIGVQIVGAGPLLSQRRSRTIERSQSLPYVAQLDINEIANSPVITDRHLLIGNPDPTSTPNLTRIGNKPLGQNLKQRGLPTTVLPNHPEPIPGRHSQIHTMQNGMPAPHNPNPTSRQMRPGTRR